MIHHLDTTESKRTTKGQWPCKSRDVCDCAVFAISLQVIVFTQWVLCKKITIYMLKCPWHLHVKYLWRIRVKILGFATRQDR